MAKTANQTTETVKKPRAVKSAAQLTVIKRTASLVKIIGLIDEIDDIGKQAVRDYLTPKSAEAVLP